MFGFNDMTGVRIDTSCKDKFTEDYREHKCLTSENEIDEWINSIK